MEDTSSGLRGAECLLSSSSSDRNAEGRDQSDSDEYRDLIDKAGSGTGMASAAGV